MPSDVLEWIQAHTPWLPFGTPFGSVAAFGVKGSAGMGVRRKEKWLGLESLFLAAARRCLNKATFCSAGGEESKI